MARVRSGPLLPAEYQEVEYLEATGTQAFFSDVPVQDNLTVDSVQTFSGGDCYLFGGHSGKGLQSCFNGYWSFRMQNAYNGYYHWALDRISQNNTTIYHVVSTQRTGDQSGYLNGELLFNGTRTTTADVSAGANAVAFGQRNASGAINQWYRGKVYSLKVSKDGVQLANYVPCYRKADTKPGMYDLVKHKFYTNDGTGEFLYGANVN